MPTLTLRTVGMSYLIEGLDPGTLDPARLLATLAAELGEAVTPMGVPPDPEAAAPVESLLIDRKSITWQVLRDCLEAFVGDQGYSFTSWAESGLTSSPAATLHFHR